MLFTWSPGSFEECGRHPLGGVRDQRLAHVGVALGLADLGVTEHLLDNPDVDVLLQQERGCGVPGVVNARLADAGGAQQGAPVVLTAPVWLSERCAIAHYGNCDRR